MVLVIDTRLFTEMTPLQLSPLQTGMSHLIKNEMILIVWKKLYQFEDNGLHCILITQHEFLLFLTDAHFLF